MENDLTHEISVKHNFSYNGKPSEEVTHTQSPQLTRHLSKTKKEKESRSAGKNIEGLPQKQK